MPASITRLIPAIILGLTIATTSIAAPAGLLLRPGDVVEPTFTGDEPAAGDPAAPGELRIVAARNGTFSAELLVQSKQPIVRPQAKVSALRGPEGAVIPATAITVRYGVEWDSCVVQGSKGTFNARRADYLSMLVDEPPAKVEGHAPAVRKGQPVVRHDPMVSVWVTVKAPENAAPGEYTGVVTVTAGGVRPATMPLKVEVIDYLLPSPENFRTWVEMVHSPDALAIQYNVPLWSEKHWKLIERSLAQMARVGSRVLQIPLIARTSLGNEQSMVRWSKDASGKYSYDFSILDRYLETAEKAFGGKSDMIVLTVWENYMIKPDEPAAKAAAQHEHDRVLKILEQNNAIMGKGPAVTMVDGAGKISTEYMAHYTEEAAREQWQPLMDQLKQRLEKRGVWDKAMLGLINDCWPTRQEVELFQKISPELKWAMYCHFSAPTVYNLSEPAYRSQVWAIKEAGNTSLMGWKRPEMITRYMRLRNFGSGPNVTWRYWAEYCITGDQRGMGRIGADYWELQLDENSRQKQQVWERYPESTWRNLGIYVALLAPGPEGPVSSARYENLIEGVQECEARIAIEEAISDEAKVAKLGADLVNRCKTELDRRIVERRSDEKHGRPYFVWRFDKWQDESRTLYKLAAEVEAKLGN